MSRQAVTSIVAGGAGFVGSHLVDALAKRGESVVVLDNLAVGRIENLEAAISSGRTTFIYVDIEAEAVSLRNVILSTGVKNIDSIYLLASNPSAEPDRSLPVSPAVTDFGTAPLVDLAVEHGARLTFASNMNCGSGRFFDEADIAGSAIPLDNGAPRGESAITTAVRERGLNARVVQYSNCYGPRVHSDDDPLIVALLDAALHGSAMPAETTGRQRRSMTYVADAVQRLLLVAARPQALPTPVSIADPHEYSVVEIARMLARIAGIDFVPQPVAEYSFEGRADHFDGSAGVMFSWEPAMPLEDGLRKTYNWFADDQRLFV
jgi:UDP-glucuronate decarboxylase